MHYEELEELFANLSEKDKFRLVCRYVLCLPASKIASLEGKSRQAIFLTLQRAQKSLIKIQSRDDFIAALQELFARG